jgi:hypothetical protein
MKTIALTALAACLLGLTQQGCAASPAHPACTPERHAEEKTAYLARVNVACAAYDTAEECPAYPGLKADFERTIDSGCGQ